MTVDAPPPAEKQQPKGRKASKTRKSRLPRDFFFGILGALFASFIFWQFQSVIEGRQAEQRVADKMSTIRASVEAECDRLGAVFATLYDTYPTMTCDMNLYRAPRPDAALATYLEAERADIVRIFGADGAGLIRNAVMAGKSYEAMFVGPYFNATISQGTSTWQSYFRPMRDMCKWAGKDLTIQKCPYY